ncbi:MAG TPA: cobalamin-dependent protein, partial [Thermoanaerobaculia bacterium]|nr:cobalamin-dependent protein [Thermoanaerobaculia bacterium]
MRINLVSLEDGITATGFRKFAAYAEKLNAETNVFYVGTQRYRSLWKSFVRKMGETRSFGDTEIDEIAHGIAGADVIAFSSMTGYADLTKALATRVRELNPHAYTMWGGIHPIIYPEDAIKADV